MSKPPKLRSGFEKTLLDQMTTFGAEVEYENARRRLAYVQPSKSRSYLPDFTFKTSPIIIEAKGRLTRDEREKLLLIKRSNPEVDLRLVFMRDNKLSRKPRSLRYSSWAEKHGFPFAVGSVPKEWLDEIKGSG